MTSSKNGAAVTNGATAPKTEVKTTVPVVAIPTKKAEEEKLPPLDDRLHRLNVLFELQSKYNRLQASLQKLNDFVLNKDSETGGLKIYDSKRDEFSTGNTEIVSEVVAFLKMRIKEKIKAIEPQLKW